MWYPSPNRPPSPEIRHARRGEHRRRRRPLALILSLLEGRQMLSTATTAAPAMLVPVVVPVSTDSTTTTGTATNSASVGPILSQGGATSTTQPPTTIDPGDSPGMGPGAGPDSPPRMTRFSTDGPPPPGYATPLMKPGRLSGTGPPADDRIAMDVNKITINGVTSREFAFADQSTGTVIVHNGAGSSMLAGIAQPQAVALEDINGDGLPDLIVADSGNNRVLVFPGLKDGTFGAEVDAGLGFAVGVDPVSITVASVNGDGVNDLIVANKGSDSVSILMSQGAGAGWSLAPQLVIPDGPSPQQAAAAGQAMTSPVAATLMDVNKDQMPDLLVLNSGTNQVRAFPGQGDGTFDLAHPLVVSTGLDPTSMLVGRFDHRPGLDLLTVNSGSNDLSLISGISSGTPSTVTVTSGGVRPDSAFAVDLSHDGTMDLVVANGGDGRLALLQAGSVGMQLAGVISRADLPTPTAIAEGTATSGGFDFYAVTAGQDAAAILHFDLNTASDYLNIPLAPTEAANPADGELVAQIYPYGESPDALIAVLFYGKAEADPQATDRELTSAGVYYARTEAQGGLDPTAEATNAATDSGGETDLKLKPDAGAVPSSSWARFVSGIDAALDGARGVVAAVTDFDVREARLDRGVEDTADDRPVAADLDDEAADSSLRAALDSLRDRDLKSQPATEPAPSPATPARPAGPTVPAITPAPRSQGNPHGGPEAAPLEARSDVVPLMSTVVLAARLVLKAKPPRPPIFRRRPAATPAPGLAGGTWSL